MLRVTLDMAAGVVAVVPAGWTDPLPWPGEGP